MKLELIATLGGLDRQPVDSRAYVFKFGRNMVKNSTTNSHRRKKTQYEYYRTLANQLQPLTMVSKNPALTVI